MKKGLSLFMAVLVLLSLAGCGGGITEEEYQQVCKERDALQSELRELKDAAPVEADTIQVTISGTFTATVRAFIPDYAADDTTPSMAAITLFQCSPFLIYTGEFTEQLETGETYVFEIRPKTVEITAEEYEINAPDPEVVFPKYNLRLAGFRESVESDWGLDSVHLVYEKCDDTEDKKTVNEKTVNGNAEDKSAEGGEAVKETNPIDSFYDRVETDGATVTMNMVASELERAWEREARNLAEKLKEQLPLQEDRDLVDAYYAAVEEQIQRMNVMAIYPVSDVEAPQQERAERSGTLRGVLWAGSRAGIWRDTFYQLRWVFPADQDYVFIFDAEAAQREVPDGAEYVS